MAGGRTNLTVTNMPPPGWAWADQGEPPDEAIVVRGGVLDEQAKRTALRAAKTENEDPEYRSFEIYPVSVQCAVRGADEEWRAFLCRVASMGEVRNKKVRWTTAGRVRAGGFRFFRSPPPPSHYDVDLGSLDPAALDRLVGVFEAPEENPCPWTS